MPVIRVRTVRPRRVTSYIRRGTEADPRPTLTKVPAEPPLESYPGLPGAELVTRGVEELASGRETPEAMLVAMALRDSERSE